MDELQFFQWIKEKGFDLTEQQKTAAKHGEGPLLLLAVPGSGKTTTLIIRLAYMIHVLGIAPESILCLTFGKAAANEMRERYRNHFGGDAAGTIQFSTIHSFAYEVTRQSLQEQGIAYRLIEELSGAESKSGVLRRISEGINHTVPTEEQLDELRNAICFVKNTLGGPETVQSELGLQGFPSIFKAYEEYKVSHKPRLIDYDDMLTLAFAALQNRPELLAKYRARFPYVLTDESQDTSLLQHRIIEMIAKPRNNIFLVGDDDQSIYRFRAAEPGYLLNFHEVYPGANVLRMERNFRSTAAIVDTACRFIRTNTLRYDKQMFTENPEGASVRILSFAQVKDQNTFLAMKLVKSQADVTSALAATSETSLSAMGAGKTAVLFRNTLTAILVVDELDRAGIPFCMKESGKDRFFGHWVVQDILNFLRFSFSDKNLPILERIYTKFDSQIAKNQLNYLSVHRDGRSLFDILTEQTDLKPGQKKRYQENKERFRVLNTLQPAGAIRYIRNGLGYDNAVKRICDAFGFSKGYIDGLLDILTALAEAEPTLTDFARRLSHLEDLIKSSYRNKYSNAVTLSTIHSAKGMEWESVYLIDLVEGIIPDAEAVKANESDRIEALEEERRLFYVGMTRAKKELTLCCLGDLNISSKEKNKAITSAGKEVIPSRFVREVAWVLNGEDPKELYRKASPLKAQELVSGLVITHKIFGPGVIIKEEPSLITIRFEDGLIKLLMKDICERQQLITAN